MSVLAGIVMPVPARAAEDRVLRVRAAGFVRRLIAAVVDVGLLAGLCGGVTLGAAAALKLPLPTAREIGPDLLVAGILDRSPIAIGFAGLFFGLGALYHVYFGGVAGQTPGKRLCGIRVITSRGIAPGPARGALRLLALAVSLLPAGLGWIWALFDRERRALHDHLCGTYVIRDR